ncbi:TRAP transporter large permease [Hoeflea sp. TYP-13]|uniref:TRAP transporter large permease n=1 Tax=Hoeflea sp. TYP-13 TaxID=3230023 RepID=UPI0034C683FF
MLVKTLLILLALIFLAVPVAASLGWLGLTLQYLESPMPLHRALGDMVWQTGTDFLLVAIPMFVLLGEILLRAGITERMYEGIVRWVGWLPGGLMHSNIGSSALFAATSGSSVATAATIGTVAVPQIEKRGYNEPLFLGTIAAGGTLGILIPPSINLILYGLLTDTSVPELYLAGFIPGFLLASLFMGTIVLLCVLRRSWGGEAIRTDWASRFAALPALVPPIGIFLVVVGSIYAGLATPTEAASLGVVAAMILAAFNGKLNLTMLRHAVEGTMRTTSMIMLIILAAVFLNFVLSVIGLTTALTDFVSGLGLTPFQTMLLIIGVLVILGCFMETLSMLLTTAPIITPIVIALGYDAVWFGILLMVLLETALITPPIGINLYVVQGIRSKGDIVDVMKGAAPFVLTMFAMIALLLAFPQLALWLPSLVY